MFAERATSPYCFYEVTQAAADLTRLERNSSRRSRWLRRGIDPPHVSIRQLAAVCTRARVPMCVHAHRPAGPIELSDATGSQCDRATALCAITEGEINRDPDQTLLNSKRAPPNPDL